MIKGKSYPTGVCKKELTKEDKKLLISTKDNVTDSSFKGHCKVRKGGYVPNLNPAESRDGFLRN